MDGVTVGDDCIVAAGALLTPGTVIPAGHLAVGSPAKVSRPLKDAEKAFLKQSALNYVGYSEEHRASRG
jgi:carbonic anhydrase/acetyltransferase-like protein (isoleucine patch superfamily)